MRSVEALLQNLRELGIRLRVDEGKLRYQAPKGLLTAGLKTEIRDLKPHILEFFKEAGQVSGSRRPPLRRIPRNGTMLPLSFAQRRLWFIDQLGGESDAYHIPIALRFLGMLDRKALEQSLHEISRRHEALRTRFPSRGGTPFQVIEADLAPSLPLLDLSVQPAAEREQELDRRTIREGKRPFELASGPLVRLTLFCMEERDHVLLITMHHIISDGWSVGVMIRELTSLYHGNQSGLPHSLPELTIQYADFSAWQRDWLSGGALERQRAYWIRQLRGSPELLTLPTDRARPARQTFAGGQRSFDVDDAVTLALNRISRESEATLFMTLLAAYALLLSRYSGQDDVLLGTPVANRDHKQIEPLIGFFVNTLVLRTDCYGDPTFSTLLQRVKKTLLEANAHQDIPFDLVVEALQPARDFSYSPLFQVMFALQNIQMEPLELPGLTLRPLKPETVTAKFDLTMNLMEHDGRITGAVEYNSDLFEARPIALMIDRYQLLLKEISAGPGMRLSLYSLLSEEDRRALLVHFQGERALAFPWVDHALLLECQAERVPDSVALVCAVPPSNMTYRELNAGSDRVAGRLRALGAGHEVRVGILMERSALMIMAMFGSLKTGAAYVALDPHYPEDRLAFILADAGIEILITSSGFPEEYGGIGTLMLEGPLGSETSGPALAAAGAEPENLAHVIYTSGSTGTPKGVMIRHHAVARLLHWTRAHFRPEELDGLLAATSICFDLSVFEIFGALCHGGTVILARDAMELSSLPDRNRVRLINTVPSAMSELLHYEGVPTSVRFVNLAGEPLRAELVRGIFALGTGIMVRNLYGPCEDTTYSTALRVETGEGEEPTIGYPLEGTRVFILDRQGNLLPPGIPGELCLAGEGLARGYHARPALTAENFTPDPFSGQAGGLLYRTGDQARYTVSGKKAEPLVFMGRLDHQVKLRGFRIEPGEIRGVLIAFPAVRDGVVILRRGAAGLQRLIAFVVTDSKWNKGILARLTGHLKQKLPEYMLPSVIIPLDALPLTPNGKLDRLALARLPLPDGAEPGTGYQPPCNPIEEILCGIWTDILGFETPIGIDLNFFDAGGHSLLATRVVSRVNNLFDVRLSVRILFEAPTIRALAGRVRAPRACQSQDSLPDIVIMPRQGPLPVSFAQERLWFLDRLEGPSAIYNLPTPLRLSGVLDVMALEQAVGELIRRHESLRTTLDEREGIPVQIIRSGGAFSLPIVDLAGLPEPERVERTVVDRESLIHFDLSQGPLYRAGLLITARDNYSLLLNAHHIISDGWSLTIMIREIAAMYGAFSRGQPSPLEPLAHQYADFACWQRQVLDGEGMAAQLAYWKTRLGQDLTTLDLPTDRNRPLPLSYEGSAVSLCLPAELSDALRGIGLREGASLFMTLLAAFKILLGRVSGQNDVVVGTPIAGRTQLAVEPLIGFFINTLVLRTDLSGPQSESPRFREVLSRVREITLGAYDHQDVPFARLVEELQPERDQSRNPLFQVFFNMLNLPSVAVSTAELRIESISLPEMGAKFDFTLYVDPTAPEIVLHLHYNILLFERERMVSFLDQYRYLCERITEDPERRIHSYSLVTEAAKFLLPEVRAPLDDSWPGPVSELFAEHALREPDRIALRAADEVWTYGELDRLADRLAGYLNQHGVVSEDIVVVYGARVAGLVLAVMGILKAGGAFVILDPAYPVHRLKALLSVSRPKAWVGLAAAGPVPEDLSPEISPCTCRLTLSSDAGDMPELRTRSPHRLPVPIAARDLACLTFTSGSTGTPKGVMGLHGSLTHFLPWMAQTFELTREDRFGMLSGLAHDPLQRDIFTPLNLGAALCIPEPGDLIPGRLADWMLLRRISIAHLTPAMCQILTDSAGDKRLESFRQVFIVGDLLMRGDIDNLRALAPRVGIVNLYGSTETQRALSYLIICAEGEKTSSSFLETWFKEAMPLGRGMPDAQLLILNAAGRLAGVGELGEIHVRSPHLARGYSRDAVLSGQRFLSNPFTEVEHDRLYQTGDLGRYLPDGKVELVGRTDFQVNIRGFRIEPGEIEGVLAHHGGVAEVVVLARPDRMGTLCLVAYVRPAIPRQRNASALKENLKLFLAQRLPVHMVPAWFVFLDAFPLTPNNKLDRRALPLPDESQAAGELAYTAPRSATEETLAKIWAAVLGVERVGVFHNFFDLGGHSLLGTQVIARIRDAFQCELPLRELFASPTVAALAKGIERAGSSGPALPPILPLDRPSLEESDSALHFELSFAQLRIWILDRLDPHGAAYIMPAAVKLRGALPLLWLERGFHALLERHEILRAQMIEKEGAPSQVMRPLAPVPIVLYDIQALTGAAGEAEVQRIIERVVRTRFDLESEPLLRFVTLKTAADEHLILVAMHHIVSDGWSVGLFVEELSRLFLESRAPADRTLAPLPIQYGDYAHWQKKYFTEERLEPLRDFWLRALKGIPASIDLPTDYPRPPTKTYHGDTRELAIGSEVFQAMRGLGRDRGATTFMVLLAALKAVLFKWTGQRDLVVGTVVAGRTRSETEKLIGCFMNFLALRSRVKAELTTADFLKQVQQTVFDAYAHQDLPFEKVVEALNPSRGGNQDPIYNVALLLQNLPVPPSFGSWLRAEAVPLDTGAALLDMRFVAYESAQGILLKCEYSPDLFEAVTIELVLEAIQSVLEAFLHQPELTLGRLELPRELDSRARAAREREQKQTIAVAATFTAEPLAPSLEFWMDELGYPTQLSFAAYQQVFQELLDPSSRFNTNTHGLNLILLRFEDWLKQGESGDDAEPPTANLAASLDDLIKGLDTSSARVGVPLLVCLCHPSPAFRENQEYAALTDTLEERLTTALASMSNVYLVTPGELEKKYPSADYYDEHRDGLGHIPFYDHYFTALGTMIARRLHALNAKPFKAIVLDCDETLWRGVCGEDGPEGIRLDASRKALQAFMKAQRESGKVLCLCSKNSESDVRAVFRNQGANMPLAWDDMVTHRINWQPKSSNIRAMAEELNLGLDSFIFVDDNPVECAEVRHYCPEVTTLRLPSEPRRINGFLENMWVFDVLKTTEEDRQRSERYQQSFLRERYRKQTLTLKSFLDSLNLEISVAFACEENLPRVAQLTRRTNQFNFTTIRRSENELSALVRAGGQQCRVVSLRDRFGDYGLVGVMICAIEGQALLVDTFLLSCRALGRGTEHLMLADLGAMAESEGLKQVVIRFRPTARNQPARDFLESVGQSERKREAEETRFVFPAAVAREARFEPGDASSEPTVRPKIEAVRPRHEWQSRWQQYERIALELHDPRQILHTIEARALRARPETGDYVAPRSPREEVLANIWMEVLGLDKVGVHDNFFALKGHSLLGTQVIARIREAFQCELPLRELFASPTVAALAKEIERAGSSGPALPPILPLDRPSLEEPGSALHFELSFAQRRLWFLDKLEGPSAAYNMPVSLCIEGAFDLSVLERAFAMTERRHETLRTTFPEYRGKPVQAVHPFSPAPIPLLDLTGLPLDTEESLSRALMRECSLEPFHLLKGPVWRRLLIRLGKDSHLLTLVLHHIISDGWSNGVLVREMVRIYGTLSAPTGPDRQEDVPSELSVQYADFAHWQRQWLQGSVLEGQLRFWRRHLEGAPPRLELPTDRARPALQRSTGGYHTFTLDSELTGAIGEFCRAAQVTLFMTLLSAWKVLLARYSRQDDIVVGTPIANRKHERTEGLIGLFANTLATRTRLSGRESFHHLVGRVRERILGAYANQDLPFEKLVEALKPARDLSYSPIFQVMFILQNAPVGELTLPGLAFKLMARENRTAKFDLTLTVMETADGLASDLEYDRDLFDGRSIRGMAHHWRNLLWSAIGNPLQPLAALNLMDETERHQLLETWNHTPMALPRVWAVHHRFEARALRHPERVAITTAVPKENAWTYGHLEASVEGLARQLRRMGVGPASRVGICHGRTPEMVAGLLAVLKTGAAYVPLDPSFPEERLAFMMADAALSVLLVNGNSYGRLPRQEVPTLMLDPPLSPTSSLARSTPPVFSNQHAYMLYTSGSTGRPKGVQVSHRALGNFLESMRTEPGFDTHDRLLAVTTISFDIAGLELYLPLITGGVLDLAGAESAGDASFLANRLKQTGTAVMQATPATWRMLLDSGWAGQNKLKILCGGEALPGGLARRLIEKGHELWNLYGPTETTIWSTRDRIQGPVEKEDEGLPCALGSPIANTRVYLLDNRLCPVPVGVPGILFIGGSGLATGYWKHPRLTAMSFLPNSFAGRPGRRLYGSGDLARYRADGSLTYLGRVDHQVKLRGFRIELGEIEAALARHPDVGEAAVTVHEAAVSGGDGRLCAYLVPRHGDRVPARVDLRAWLQRCLPDYMIPADFIMLPKLPLTPNNKVDRKALPDQTRALRSSEVTPVPPRTPVEKILAGIWTDVLGIHTVSVYDHFFDLGGHSLLANQVVSRIRDAFGVELPLRTLFLSPVLEAQAGAIVDAKRDCQIPLPPPIQTVSRVGRQHFPLSFAQLRLWFLDRLDPHGAAYNLPTALRLSGTLDVSVLERAIDRIVERHEVLRAVFGIEDGEPVQRFLLPEPLVLSLTDGAGLSSRDREEWVKRQVRIEAGRPFSLAEGPLLRVLLLRLDEGRHLLLATKHHIVSDGWSNGIMIRELSAFYREFTTDRPSSLPELRVQYADFALWQRSLFRDEPRQIDYWREQLAQAPAHLELPTDMPRPSIQSYAGRRQRFFLEETQTRALRDLAREAGATLFMVLEGAFSTLLSRYSGQTDILIGTPTANRAHREIETLIGFFVNTVVLRHDLSGNPGFHDYLGGVRQTALDAFSHQDLPFEKVVEALRPERNLDQSPLFQVLFVLANTPRGELDLPGLRLEPFPGEDFISAKFDLTLAMEETAWGCGGSLEYNTALFRDETARRMIDHFQALLQGMAANPAGRLFSFPLMGEAERLRILFDWNDTEADYPRNRCLQWLVEDQVRRDPNRMALVFDPGAPPLAGQALAGKPSVRLSYARLNTLANRLAGRLRSLGVGPESLVCVCMERSAEMVVSLLGVMKAGGAYVPLDPELPMERLDLMLRDTGAAVLLSQPHLAGRLPANEAQTLLLDSQNIPNLEADEANPRFAMDSANPAYLIYTSGSTGTPKGAMNTHRAICNRLNWMQRDYGLTAEDAVLQKTPYSFDVSVWEFFWPLITGARLVMAMPGGHHDPSYLAAIIEKQNITTLHFVPSMLRVFLSETDHRRCGSLRRVVCSGEVLPGSLREHFFNVHGAQLHNLYGPTEAAIDVTHHTCRRDPENLSVPIGKPIDNSKIFIVDAYLEPLPVGIAGEVLIGGEGLARGYNGRPGQSAEFFIPNPFAAREEAFSIHGCRLYRSGDRARFSADGTIEYLGRLDQQVKLRGFRIEPGEIEAAAEAHAKIRQAAVILDMDHNGEPCLIAYLVACPGSIRTSRDERGEEELRAHLKKNLPPYMVPAHIVFLDALPLTANGKLDRKALPQPGKICREEGAGNLPRNALERELAQIWSEVLGLERVRVHDNFFDVGGQSLKLIKVNARLKEAFKRDISMVEMFQYPTIHSLAKFLSASVENRPLEVSLENRVLQRPAGRIGADGEIAVIGMAGRFPGAGDLETFWRNIRNGVESISFFSDEELLAAGIPPAVLANPRYVKAGGALEQIELFDASFFGYSAREAETMDPQHRLFLECAWQALETAAYGAGTESGAIGVFAGVGLNTYVLNNLYQNPDFMATTDPYRLMLANDKDYLATRVSYKLNLKGPSINVQTACSTSLVAIHLARESLCKGDCEIALAGGVALRVPARTGYLYQEGMISSPDGHCRAFDARAGGTIGGSGVGVVVLKPLVKALADGDCIGAVIKGSAINNDGSMKVSFTSPSVEGQASVIADALVNARVHPETIGFVEAHGTGTTMGDPIEVAALTHAYRLGTGKKGYCALGSLKANMGHLDAAAGVAGLIKTVLALKHREIPASVNFSVPNPNISFEESPFFVNTEMREWERTEPSGTVADEAVPRRAGVSSFGIGGTNAHVILEEAPPIGTSGPSRGTQVLMLSAKTRSALQTMASRLADHLRIHPETPLADVAYTLQVGRKRMPYRRIVPCGNLEHAILSLEDGDAGPAVHGDSLSRSVAFMFTGQGAQRVKMAGALYKSEPEFRDCLEACSRILEPVLAGDLREILYPAKDCLEEAGRVLQQTRWAQPALFAVEYALARLWMCWGIQPGAMIGHSIGEYVAACLAGVFSLEDALLLVAERGRLMQSLPPGAMLAVPLGEERMRPYLDCHTSIAALNTPSRCVVSGPVESISVLESRLREEGLASSRLPTSHAFHSAMMDPILESFRAKVAKLKRSPPQIPYISNLSGSWIKAEEATSPDYWMRHLRNTVRFQQGLDHLLQEEGRILLEIGPGRTLAGFAHRHPAKKPGHLVLTSLYEETESGPDPVPVGLGKLWAAGMDVNWKGFYRHEVRRRIPLPTYPFEKRRYWIDPHPEATAASLLRGTKRAPLAQWFYTPTWKRSIPTAIPAESNSPRYLVLFSESPELGEALAVELEQRGLSAIVVCGGTAFKKHDRRRYSLNPRDESDLAGLWRDLSASGIFPGLVLYLWSLSGEVSAPPEGILNCGSSTPDFRGPRNLLRFLGNTAEARVERVLLVTHRLARVTGEEPTDPTKAGILGMVAAGPGTVGPRCQVIDVGPRLLEKKATVGLASQLLDELNRKPAKRFIAFRGGHRWERHLEPVPLPGKGQVRLKAGAVFWISDDWPERAFVLAGALAETAGVKLVMVHAPTGVGTPSHGNGSDLARLAESGAELIQVDLELSDSAGMSSLIDRIEKQWGPIDGVFHGLPESLKSDEQDFEKRLGEIRSLAAIFQHRSKGFLLIHGGGHPDLDITGNQGPTAIAAVLDAMAESSEPRIPIFSVCWNLAVAKEGKSGHIRAGEIAAVLNRILLSPIANLRVSPLPLDQLGDLTGPDHRDMPPPPEKTGVKTHTLGTAHPRPELATAFSAPRYDTERKLAELWQLLLGIEGIGISDNFLDLGGDSLLAVQVNSRLRELFEIDLPLAILFGEPTVAGLAGMIHTLRDCRRPAELDRDDHGLEVGEL